MTDIVEQAAKVLSKNWRNMHTNEALGQQRMLAQALADAGLLAIRPTKIKIHKTTNPEAPHHYAIWDSKDRRIDGSTETHTVAEVKAQALEEAADAFHAAAVSEEMAEELGWEVNEVERTRLVNSLRARAQQIRQQNH